MATVAQTSRTVAEKFVERLGRQDPDGIQELFAEEIDWHVDGGDVVLPAVSTHTVPAGGKEFTTPTAMHPMVDNNRIVRMHLYEDTLAVAEAFHAG